MKKVFSFIITLVMCLSLTSCVTTAEAQTDGVYVSTDGVDVDVIITYGTPYYDAEGLLLYYIYRNYYYYPFYTADRWYFRAYSRPLRYVRPYPRDFYRHRPHVNHGRPYVGSHNNHRPNVGNHRPNSNIHRPSISTRPQSRPQINNRGGGFSRPSSPQRSSTRGGRSFGGRR